MEYNLKKLKNNNKNKAIFVILTIIMCLGISLAATYFIYIFNDERENSLTTALISLNFTDKTGGNILLDNTVPVIDEVGLENTPYEFTVTNTSQVPINVNFQVIENPGNTLPIEAIRYGLYANGELIVKDSLANLDEAGNFYVYNNFPKGETLDCKIIFWVDYYYEISGQTFSAKLKITGESFDIIYEPIPTDASCFTVSEIEQYKVNQNMTDDELAVCGDFFVDYMGTGVAADYANFCRGLEAINSLTFQDIIDFDFRYWSSDDINYLKDNNVILQLSNAVVIDGYDLNCGSVVVIPSTINGLDVVTIGERAFFTQPITSVVIPDTVIIIEENAFNGCELQEVIIPNSVKFIEQSAFKYNPLTSVKFANESNIHAIFGLAFANASSSLTKVIIPDSIEYMDCSAFDSTVNVIVKDGFECTDRGSQN